MIGFVNDIYPLLLSVTPPTKATRNCKARKAPACVSTPLLFSRTTKNVYSCGTLLLKSLVINARPSSSYFSFFLPLFPWGQPSQWRAEQRAGAPRITRGSTCVYHPPPIPHLFPSHPVPSRGYFHHPGGEFKCSAVSALPAARNTPPRLCSLRFRLKTSVERAQEAHLPPPTNTARLSHIQKISRNIHASETLPDLNTK